MIVFLLFSVTASNASNANKTRKLKRYRKYWIKMQHRKSYAIKNNAGKLYSQRISRQKEEESKKSFAKSIINASGKNKRKNSNPIYGNVEANIQNEDEPNWIKNKGMRLHKRKNGCSIRHPYETTTATK